MFVALIPISDGLKHREMAHKESGEKSLPLFNVSLYRYIYIYAQRLGSAQALQRIYVSFTNK